MRGHSFQQRPYGQSGSPLPVTASYNNAATIGKTIASVKNQTFQNLEHIIIDNCSTDGTLDIIREHEGTYPLQWISEPDRGIADALNKGLERAKGKYILALHADDYLLNEHSLDDVYPELKGEGLDIVSGKIIYNHRVSGENAN